MPIKVIKYTCQYRCRHKAIPSKKKIEEHESGCWFNPANRTCKSCRHEVYGIDEDTYYRQCKDYGGQAEVERHLDELTAKLEFKYQEELKQYSPDCPFDIKPVRRHVEDSPIPPVVDCIFWENKKGEQT